MDKLDDLCNELDFGEFWQNVSVGEEVLRGVKLREAKGKACSIDREFQAVDVSFDSPPQGGKPVRKTKRRRRRRIRPNSLRAAELAAPSKRYCLSTWRERYDRLPIIVIDRLRKIVTDETQIIKVADAIECFKYRSRKTKNRCDLVRHFKYGYDDQKNKVQNQRLKKTTGIKTYSFVKRTHSGERLAKIIKQEPHIYRYSVILGKKIIKQLLPTVVFDLNPYYTNICNIIASDMSDVLRKKKHGDLLENEKIKVDIAKKVTVWIADVLEEASHKLLLEDLKELEEEEGPVLDLLDEIVNNAVPVRETESDTSRSTRTNKGKLSVVDENIESDNDDLEDYNNSQPIQIENTLDTIGTLLSDTFESNEIFPLRVSPEIHYDDILKNREIELSKLSVVDQNIENREHADHENDNNSQSLQNEDPYAMIGIFLSDIINNTVPESEHVFEIPEVLSLNISQEIIPVSQETINSEGQYDFTSAVNDTIAIKISDITEKHIKPSEDDENDLLSNELMYQTNNQSPADIIKNETNKITQQEETSDDNFKKNINNASRILTGQKFHDGEDTLVLNEDHTRISNTLDNNKKSKIVFASPKSSLLSDADEIWPQNLSSSPLRPSASVSKSMASLGRITETDEKKHLITDKHFENDKKPIGSSEILIPKNKGVVHDVLYSNVLKKSKSLEENIINSIRTSNPRNTSSLPQLNVLVYSPSLKNKNLQIKSSHDTHKFSNNDVKATRMESSSYLNIKKTPLNPSLNKFIENKNEPPFNPIDKKISNDIRPEKTNRKTQTVNDASMMIDSKLKKLIIEQQPTINIYPRCKSALYRNISQIKKTESINYSHKCRVARIKLSKQDMRQLCFGLQNVCRNLELWMTWIQYTTSAIMNFKENDRKQYKARLMGIKEWKNLKSDIDNDCVLWLNMSLKQQSGLRNNRSYLKDIPESCTCYN